MIKSFSAYDGRIGVGEPVFRFLPVVPYLTIGEGIGRKSFLQQGITGIALVLKYVPDGYPLPAFLTVPCGNSESGDFLGNILHAVSI